MMRAVADPSGASRPSCAPSASGGETLGAETAGLGPRGARRHHQRILRPDRMQHDRSPPARRSWRSRPGVMGQPVPGHDVAVIDADGSPAPDGVLGMIAVRAARSGDVPRLLGERRGDAAQIPRRLADRPATRASRDDGRLSSLRRPRRRCHHLGRLPDRPRRDRGLPDAPSGGGDGGGVGKPDALRSEIVKAFVVLKTGFAPSDRSPARSDHVKTRLAAHEYPREVAFLDSCR